MNLFIESFRIPNYATEQKILGDIADYNGGAYGYINNPYPCEIFPDKHLNEITFAPITIFYGGNGSGKTTLLNIIANKLELARTAPFNSGETFDSYVEKCEYTLGYNEEGNRWRISNESRIITSDDVFDYMITVRTKNQEYSEDSDVARSFWNKRRTEGGLSDLNPLDDYEEFRIAMMARQKSLSRRKFILRTAGEEIKLNSNGETALNYFTAKMKDNSLYCLDEPENSLSPKMQIELVKILENQVRFFGCQLIIATHSPFLLALKGSRIYDLDANPVDIKNWWELENIRTYFEFFKKNENLFL